MRSSCKDSYVRETDLLRGSDHIRKGGNVYVDWCRDVVRHALDQRAFVAAGGCVVPQVGEKAGLRLDFQIGELDTKKQEELVPFLDAIWESINTETRKLNHAESIDLESLTLVPLAPWFTQPIGFLWAFSDLNERDLIEERLAFASHFIALAVRATKSVHALHLLSEPTWVTDSTTIKTAEIASRSCREALACNAVVIFEAVKRESKQILETLATSGIKDARFHLEIPFGAGVAGVVALDNKIVVLNDLRDPHELRAKGFREILNPKVVQEKKWRSGIFAPFDIGGECAGVMAAYAIRPHAFSDIDKEIVQSFCQRLASGYAHIRRFEQLVEMEARLGLEAPYIETGILAMEHIHDSFNSLGIAQANIGEIINRDRPERESKLRKNLDVASQTVDFALKILKLLRDGARLDRVNLERHNISDIVTEVCEKAKREAERKNIRIKPTIIEDIKIICDRNQIQRALRNFIDNSIFFLEGVKRNQKYVSVVLEELKGGVGISVTDNGPGINEEDLPRVFDYLFTSKGAHKGMGFGLAIAKRIVERNHQGELRVASKWGEETTFNIFLPLDPRGGKIEKGTDK